MEEIGFRQLEIAPFASVGHWHDPDMLEVGNGGMTDDEYRTHMGMWAMLRAPLLAGNDVRTMPDATKAILMNRDVIAIDQDRAGKPARLLKKEGDTEIWIRPLSDGANAVAFFNKGSQPANVSLQWSEIGGKPPQKGHDSGPVTISNHLDKLFRRCSGTRNCIVAVEVAPHRQSRLFMRELLVFGLQRCGGERAR